MVGTYPIQDTATQLEVDRIYNLVPVPTGAMLKWYGSLTRSLPPGYLLGGTIVAKKDYQDLYRVLFPTENNFVGQFQVPYIKKLATTVIDFTFNKTNNIVAFDLTQDMPIYKVWITALNNLNMTGPNGLLKVGQSVTHDDILSYSINTLSLLKTKDITSSFLTKLNRPPLGLPIVNSGQALYIDAVAGGGVPGNLQIFLEYDSGYTIVKA